MGRALLLVMLALPLALGSHLLHKRMPRLQAEQAEETVFVPPGALLGVLSLGHQRLVADLLWLEAIQYYGDKLLNKQQRRMPNLYPFFDAITDLDPGFERGYVFGAFALADDMQSPDLALALLEKGIACNPQPLGLLSQAGFISYFYLKNPVRAAAYFSRAAAIPGAPPLAQRLAARLYASGGDLDLSLSLWRDIYESAKDGYTRERALRNMLTLKARLDLERLEAAIAAYRAREKHPPGQLGQLAPRDLAGLPLDPLKRPYRYEPATGRVSVEPWPWESP